MDGRKGCQIGGVCVIVIPGSGGTCRSWWQREVCGERSASDRRKKGSEERKDGRLQVEKAKAATSESAGGRRVGEE